MKKINFKWRVALAALSSLFLMQTQVNAQCLTAPSGQYPGSTVTPTNCNGITPNSIATNNWAGEYAVIQVTTGQTYTFTSSVATDYFTISTDAGLTAATQGVQPLTWVSTITGTIHLYIHTNASCGTQNSARATNIICGLPPTCMFPGAASVTNITPNSATLNWTASSSAPGGGYEYYYSDVNTAPTSSSTPNGSVGAGVLTANIGSLNPSSTYYAWVRSVCLGPDYSPWSSLGSFVTDCLPAATPFTENFTNTTFAPDCWRQAYGVLASPTVFEPIVSQWGRANYSDASASTITNGSARINIYGDIRKGWLISPLINLGTTPKQLEFDLSLTSYYSSAPSSLGSDQKFAVLISTDGVTWSAANVLQQWTSATPISNGLGNHVIIDLTAYSGNVKIAFYGEALGTSPTDIDLFVDNVSVVPWSSCNAASGVAISNITNIGATISWLASTSASAQGYEWEVRSSGAAGSGTAGLAASGSTLSSVLTANATGLAASTQYSVYVRTLCSGSATSSWTTAALFTTLCNPSTAPFYQNFDGGVLPTCWTNSNATNNTSANALWKFTGTPDYGAASNGRTSGTFAWVDASTPYVDSVRLTTPFINLTGLTAPYIKFDLFKNNTDPASPQLNSMFYVQVNNGAGWNTVYTNSTNSSIWRTEGVALPSSYNNTTVQVRFCVNKTASNNFYDDILLDSVSVVNAPSCLVPTIPSNAVSNVTSNSAIISWSAPVTPPAVGYEYYYSDNNTPPTSSSTINGTTTPSVLSESLGSLNANTVYYFWVRSACSASDKSAWSTMGSFFTGYCQPAPSSVDENGIINVVSGTFSNPTTTEPNNYGNYSAMTIPANVGQTFEMKVILNVDGYPYSTKVWVDWNNNLIFDSPSEEMFAGYAPGLSATSDTVNVSFAIPATATAGNYRMRIVSNDDVWGSPTTPCYTGQYGAVEDYTLSVVTCTPPVVNIGNDTAVCSGSSLSLNAGTFTGATYLWNTTATTQTISVSAAGTYYVTVSVGACSTTDTITVTLNSLPIVSLGNDTGICAGGSVSLNAENPGATYLWSNAATTQTINVSTGGSYSVAVTNANGCVGDDTIVITAYPTVIVALGNDTSICADIELILDAEISGADYMWDDASTIGTRIIDAAGTYYVTVTDTNGCTATDTIVVALHADASGTIGITAGSAAGSYTFSVNNPLNVVTAIWNFGDQTASQVGSSVPHSYEENGTYTVTLKLVNICGDTVTVTQSIMVDGIVGINKIKLDESQLSLYPNPAQSVVTVANNSGYTLLSVSAYNVLGQQVYNAQATDNNTHQINVTSFAVGVYTVRIETSKGIVTRKFEVLK